MLSLKEELFLVPKKEPAMPFAHIETLPILVNNISPKNKQRMPKITRMIMKIMKKSSIPVEEGRN